MYEIVETCDEFVALDLRDGERMGRLALDGRED